MTLPILHLSGTPYEQGQQHGHALAADIRHNLALYFRRFRDEVYLARPEVLARAERYLAAIGRQNADYMAGMRGIADGADLDLLEIATLNVRYEIMYHGYTVKALADGCTSLAIDAERSTTGNILMAQNWDWFPGVRGALVATQEPDGFRSLAFTEAGIFGGKIGLNAAGVGLLINGLNSSHDDWAALEKPFHVRCYEILRAHTFADAVWVISGTRRACSGNFVIGHSDGYLVNIEAAPDAMRLLPCEAGCLAHTNHFIDPNELNIEVPNEARIHTMERYNRAHLLLAGDAPVGVAQIQAMLADHVNYPHAICQHPDLAEPDHEQYTTIVSIIMDLGAAQMYVAYGNPCENHYDRLDLDPCRATVAAESVDALWSR